MQLFNPIRIPVIVILMVSFVGCKAPKEEAVAVYQEDDGGVCLVVQWQRLHRLEGA